MEKKEASMNRINEENKRGPSSIQAYRVHKPEEFYLKQQREKDTAWIKLANQQLRHALKTDILA